MKNIIYYKFNFNYKYNFFIYYKFFLILVFHCIFSRQHTTIFTDYSVISNTNKLI